MILELTGLPGAGKSACMSLLHTALEDRGFQIMLEEDLLQCYLRDRVYARYKLDYELRRVMLIRALGAFLYHLHVNSYDLYSRIEVGGLLGALKRAERLPCHWLAENILLANYYRDSIDSSSSGQSIFLESEGLAHLSAAVRVWSGSRYGSIGKRWLARKSCEDLVVLHVRTSIDTALERLWQRGAPRSWPARAKSTRSSARSVIARFAEAIEQSIEEYKSAGARVVTVDNSGGMGSLESKLSEFADSLTKPAMTVPEANRIIRSSKAEI